MKETTIKVLGKITLPIQKVKRVKTKCLCDDCGCELDDSCGDLRIKIETFDSMTAKEPTSVRWVCECCSINLFIDTEPSSIFDGTPDYLRMAY
jgi:hypothetical protein